MTNNLPTTLVKSEVLAGLAHWYDRVHMWMSSEAGRAALEQQAYFALHDGSYPTLRVIEAAEAGHPGADWALRQYAAEFIAAGREPELLSQVRTYVVQSMLRATPGYDWEMLQYAAEDDRPGPRGGIVRGGVDLGGAILGPASQPLPQRSQVCRHLNS